MLKDRFWETFESNVVPALFSSKHYRARDPAEKKNKAKQTLQTKIPKTLAIECQIKKIMNAADNNYIMLIL